jgi:hypothetical protein
VLRYLIVMRLSEQARWESSMRPVIIIMLGLTLAACSVRESTPERIVIEHSAAQPLPAQRQAAQHCAKFGKQAVLESQTPVAPSKSFLNFRTRTSTYLCVDAAGSAR